jgi:hypothetical protein
MIELEGYQRCQVRDPQTYHLLCWGERAYQCFHCGLFICEKHMRETYVDGNPKEYCVTCYESSQLEIGPKQRE